MTETREEMGFIPRGYLPLIDKALIDKLIAEGDDMALYDVLTQPLHEELYKRQDVSFLDQLTEGQQLLVSYDYLQTQVGQGGFIQFLANGYVGLLPDMPEWLKRVGAADMAQLVDDALKVYVLNHQFFDKELSTEAFGKLYEELKEFELLDKKFLELDKPTTVLMMRYAKDHLDEFMQAG